MTKDHTRQDGAVTAEAAVVLPVLAIFAVTLVWMICAGITQVQALDAARETARAAARSDTSGSALALGRRVAPAGSRIRVSTGADLIRVRVTSPVRGPAGLLAKVAGFHVSATAVSAPEPA